jgi:hypothetical protein
MLQVTPVKPKQSSLHQQTSLTALNFSNIQQLKSQHLKTKNPFRPYFSNAANISVWMEYVLVVKHSVYHPSLLLRVGLIILY